MEWSILSHSEIAYLVTHMEPHSYVYIFSIFCRILICITHSAYMESWLKTTHRLFKAKHQWASLNKHFLSYTSLLIILDQVKICWASENICWASAFWIYLPGGNWTAKIFFWPWMYLSDIKNDSSQIYNKYNIKLKGSVKIYITNVD